MKLRIRDNSLRLRLTRSEVEALRADGRVEAAVHFGPGTLLGYRLVADDTLSAPIASFDDDGVTVRLPAADAHRFATTEEVSLRHAQPLGADESLAILVEKDFACLVEREGEDDSDAYPHPDGGC